jgi:GNAT superfamily N-acetyltransferase
VIHFRQLDGGGPPWPTWAKDCEHWQVEYFPDEHARPFPEGLAWVMVPPAGPDWPGPVVEYVLVLDDSRRRGIGTKLVAAIKERWPSAMLTPPASEAGAALCRKVQPPPALEEVFSAEFIEQALREGVSRAELEQQAAINSGILRS